MRTDDEGELEELLILVLEAIPRLKERKLSNSQRWFVGWIESVRNAQSLSIDGSNERRT